MTSRKKSRPGSRRSMTGRRVVRPTLGSARLTCPFSLDCQYLRPGVTVEQIQEYRERSIAAGSTDPLERCFGKLSDLNEVLL